MRINKLEYIISLWDIWNGLIAPVISAGLFIFIFPHAANYTYKHSLKFRRRRVDDKNTILHKDRLLTIDESNLIREEAFNKVKRADDEVKTADRAIENLKAERESLMVSKNSFKIIYARYGHDSIRWKDVTNYLDNVLQNTPGKELKFRIENNSFPSEDPAPGFWKMFILIYQSRGAIQTIHANEGDGIELNGGSHQVIPCERSLEWNEFENHHRRTLQFGQSLQQIRALSKN